MKTLICTDFTRNWRSFRFPALLLVFLFFALLDPVSNKYMNEIIARFVEFELSLPAPTPQAAFFSFLNDVAQIGILTLIFIASGAVAKEKENGVAGWILSKPVGRWHYLGAKAVNLCGVVIAGVVAAAVVAYLYTWSLLGPAGAAGAAWATAGLVVFTLFIAILTLTLSTLLRTPLQAGGVAVLLLFMSGLLQLVVSKSAAREFYPNTLLGQLGPLVHGAAGPAEIAVPLITTLGLSVLLFIFAGARFAKAEL